MQPLPWWLSNIMNKHIRIGCLVLGWVGSLAAAPAPISNHAPSQTPPAAGQTLTEPIGSYTTYTYYGDRYRDPFIPLIGEIRNSQSLDTPRPVSSLLLKGI